MKKIPTSWDVAASTKHGVAAVEPGGDTAVEVLVDVVAVESDRRGRGEADVATDKEDILPPDVWRQRSVARGFRRGRAVGTDRDQVVLRVVCAAQPDQLAV